MLANEWVYPRLTMEGIYSLRNTSSKQPTVVKELSAKSLSSERAQAAIFSWIIDVDNTFTTSRYQVEPGFRLFVFISSLLLQSIVHARPVLDSSSNICYSAIGQVCAFVTCSTKFVQKAWSILSLDACRRCIFTSKCGNEAMCLPRTDNVPLQCAIH